MIKLYFLPFISKLENSSLRKLPSENHAIANKTPAQADGESTQLQGDDDENLSPELKAFEKAFQKMQRDYDRVGGEVGDKRLKVLGPKEVPQWNFLIELIGDTEFKSLFFSLILAPQHLDSESKQLERDIYQLLNSLKP